MSCVPICKWCSRPIMNIIGNVPARLVKYHPACFDGMLRSYKGSKVPYAGKELDRRTFSKRGSKNDILPEECQTGNEVEGNIEQTKEETKTKARLRRKRCVVG